MESLHRHGAGKSLAKASGVFLILLLIPAFLYFVYYRADSTLSGRVVEQQQTLTDITALAVKLKLENLVKIATSIAANDSVDAAMYKEDWASAVATTRDLQNSVNYYDPYIDRIALFDEDGTQKAAYPELVGGIGKNASSSDWFKALASGQIPYYVANVAQRSSSPHLRVVNIVIPASHAGKVVGFVLMQVPAENFLEFSDSVSVGTYGFVYIVDAAGNLVAHPRASSFSGSVINFANVPEVAQVLMGNSGSDIFYDAGDGEKSVATYEPVPSFGWGVVAQEPYAEAFAARNSILNLLSAVITGSVLFDILIAFAYFAYLESKRLAKRKV